MSAPATAGGSRADGIVVPGAPPASALLVPVAAGVVIEASAPGVRVAGHAVAPGTRRLLRAGERAEIGGASLELEAAPPADSTRVAAAALLRDAAAGADPIAGPRLVVLTGPAAGVRHALGAEETIGRGRAASIRLRDPQASRVHARIRLGTDGATIEDLRSKNGLRLNGVRVDRCPAPLRAGDEIGIGDTALAVEGVAPDARAGAVASAAAAPSPASPPPRQGPRRRHAAAAALLALCALALALAGS